MSKHTGSEQDKDMPVLLADSAGVIIQSNPSARELLGVDIASGKEHSGTLTDYIEIPQNLFPPNNPLRLSLIWTGKNGNRAMDTVIAPISAGADNPAIYIVIGLAGLDAETRTERIASLSRLASVGFFVSGVTHELNNPLTAVLGFSQDLLSFGGLDKNQLADMKIVAEQAKRAVGTVKNLLQFSRKQDFKPAPLDPLEPVTLAAALLKYRIESAGLKVSIAKTGTVLMTVGDKHSLQQAAAHILQKIIAHHVASQNEGIINVTAKPAPAGDSILLAFETGSATIPLGFLPEIFDSSAILTARSEDIGLCVAGEIYRSAGGSMRILNKPAETGCRFEITLPIAPAGQKSAPLEAKPARNIKADESHIGLVSADPAFSGAVQRHLENKLKRKTIHFPGITVAQGDIAVKRCGAIIIDTDDPIRSAELKRFIEYLGANTDIPLERIILSAGEGDETAYSFAKNTGISILAKPVDFTGLAELI